MTTFFVTFGVFLTVVVAMAIGVIVNNRSIKGSCGGLNDIDGLDGACDICEIKDQCKRKHRDQQMRQQHRKALSEQS